MRRVPIAPREGWQAIVEGQGLVYPLTEHDDGRTTAYWNESAYVELTLAEALRLEADTEELWGLCLDAAGAMATDLDDRRLGLPAGALDLIRESLRRDDPGVYARFDLRFDPDAGEHAVSMYELNGDTATGLVETAVVQWHWLQDLFPERDQLNSVHERLVAAWARLRAEDRLDAETLCFLYSDADTSGEEFMTCAYLQDTAAEAGWPTRRFEMGQVGWNPGAAEFRDVYEQPLRAAFKLYPWEAMLGEEFGEHLLRRRERTPTRWVEPAWRMLFSTKALLPVLWQRNPGHRLLLPAYFDGPGDLDAWVAKPLHGREGDNVTVHLADGSETVREGAYGEEGWVYQAYAPPTLLDGNHTVLGSWIVDGEAAGLLVRESDGVVTDYYSRVVPHLIVDADAPTPEQTAAWLAERAPHDDVVVGERPMPAQAPAISDLDAARRGSTPL